MIDDNNYEAEEHRIENEINKLQDIKELINLGLYNKEDIFKNSVFKYPDSFIDYIDIFIEEEL